MDKVFDLGYMGTFSADRQDALNRMLIWPAIKWRKGKFIVAGPLYPQNQLWPENVAHIEHIAPSDHREFIALRNSHLI